MRKTDWPCVGNDPGGARSSALSQIDRGNVSRLRVAWEFSCGDMTAGGTIECTPIVVDGVLYATTPRLAVVALDAATGKPRWRFETKSSGVNRGVAFWKDGKTGAARILVAMPDGRLISLDAKTGTLDPSFGRGGIVDLRAGIDGAEKGNYGVTHAPAVSGDLVYLGFQVSESQPGAPGDIRAFDIRSGREAWRFHTVPRPGEFGHETWAKDSWKNRSGANAWSGFTIDEAHGLLFCGTGSATSDFFGGDRAGDNLFANCTLALDLKTGKRRWHHQQTRHDLWDHDNPCPPIAITVRRGGRAIDALAQVTKTGYCYLYERATGKPLFPIREMPVPGSTVPGEVAAKAQPYPSAPPPFSPIAFDDKNVTDISPAARDYVLERLKTLDWGTAHLPPSLRGTVIMPGFHGGANWSGASFDPKSGFVFVNSNNIPFLAKLNPRSGGGYDFAGYTYFRDGDGYPASRPPWGSLTAIDVSRGEFAWRVPLGEYAELSARGVAQTGTENFGGSIATAGGLVFIGGTRDEKFRAFDSQTGHVLWEAKLPAGGYATPCTYEIDGRQFVVIAAGGGGKMRTESGDSYVAFALG